MLVNDWMNTPVVTIDRKDSLLKAVNLMKEHEISILPVLDGARLVGVITDRDLKRSAPSDVLLGDMKDILYHMGSVKVEAAMSTDPITVPPDYTLEEVADVFLTNNISGCPVLSYEGDLAGIITKKDLFRAVIVVPGFRKRGVVFGFMLEDRPGSIKEVTDVIRKYNARLISIMATYAKAPEGYRYVYIRAFMIERRILPQLNQELAETAKLLYMVDLRDGKRETYANY
ncbi:MAG: CBS and ACT domain-containing protein [Desulfomonile sp.]|nr:CBS and ACT domain-containing protein [Deltaproteobacteria bacterium]